MNHANIPLGAICLLLPALASAQTVVELKHSGGNCLFNTDAAGITYDAGSGHVIASNLGATPFSGPCGGVPAPNPAFTQALNANPPSPAPGAAFTLNWNTNNVDYCKTDGTTMPAGASITGWPLSGQVCAGAACAPGSITATATLAGTYSLNLQCFRNGNALPAVSNLALNVQNAGGGGSCSGHAPVIAGQQTSLLVLFAGSKSAPVVTSSANPFDQFFNDVAGSSTEPFPQAGNRAVTVAEDSNKFVSLAFSVPGNLPASMAARIGAFDTNYIPGGTPPFPQNNGISYSISQCPGDFNVTGACKKQWVGQDGDYLTFSAPEISDPGNMLCKLERGKTYYLNFITASLDALTTTKCGGSSCAVSLSYFRLQ